MTTSNAALPSHEIVEHKPTSPALTGRKFLQINVDLKLNVVTYTLDALWRVVLADEILFATFEEPKVCFIRFLKLNKLRVNSYQFGNFYLITSID